MFVRKQHFFYWDFYSFEINIFWEHLLYIYLSAVLFVTVYYFWKSVCSQLSSALLQLVMENEDMTALVGYSVLLNHFLVQLCFFQNLIKRNCSPLVSQIFLPLITAQQPMVTTTSVLTFPYLHLNKSNQSDRLLRHTKANRATAPWNWSTSWPATSSPPPLRPPSRRG